MDGNESFFVFISGRVKTANIDPKPVYGRAGPGWNGTADTPPRDKKTRKCGEEEKKRHVTLAMYPIHRPSIIETSHSFIVYGTSMQ